MFLERLSIDAASYIQKSAGSAWWLIMFVFTAIVLIVVALALRSLGHLIGRNIRTFWGLLGTTILVACCYLLWSGFYKIKFGLEHRAEMTASERAR